jgi:predicted Zn-dependent protease
MAVNLARLGSPRDSRRLLRGLLAEKRDDWETVVAYEQLATMDRDAGQLPQAETVLRQGLSRYPHSECLRTQLAFVLDAQKQPKNALEMIRQLADDAGQKGPSARRRYGMGPQETYDRALAALHENAATRVPRLARLLGEVGRDRPAAAGAAR